MNLIAAAICLPVFFIVFLIDCYFFSFSRQNIPQWQKAICAGCISSSFLQWISLIFWVVGFVRDPTGFSGEACVYLVAAEVLIILYQWTFTLTTFYLLLVMINVFLNLRKMSNTFPPYLWVVFGIMLAFSFSWIFVQSFTPYNKRCSGSDKVLYHLYQPTTIVWCVIDVASSLGVVTIFFLMNKQLSRQAQELSEMGVNSSTHDDSSSSKVSGLETAPKTEKPPNQHRVMERHLHFALKQAFVSIISMVIASVIYDLQFNKGKVNGDLVCVFCVLLYLGYGFRRVPMLWHFSGYRTQREVSKRSKTANSKPSQSMPVEPL